MKRILTSSLLAFLISFGLNAQDMIITGVFDGPLSGGTPKVVEFYVINNISDLSIYGFGSANNGGGTDGVEFTFPAQPAVAGTFLYLADAAPNFTAYFGFNADFTDGSAGINGDDAVELFLNGTAYDVFGDINVDGTGTAWDYLDGWAYRNNMGTMSTTFTVAEWTYSGINATDGETSNATAVSMFPVGTYVHGGSTGTTHNISVGGGSNAFTPSSLTITEGDNVVWTNAGGFHNINGTQATYPANPVGFGNGGAASTAWTYSFQFNTQGSYTYQCDPHAGGGMVGTITVLPAVVLTPEVQFVGFTSVVDENVGTVNIDLMITNADANATSVNVSVGASSTATNGMDYTFTSPTTVTFAGGSSANQMISVPITDDMLTEGSETIVLTLSNPTNSATLGAAMTYTITINPSDALTPDVVINEIFYNVPSTDTIEFIELYNNEATPVDLTGYSFAQGVDYIFPAITMAAGSYLVITNDSLAFQNAFGVTARQWTSGSLVNSSESIELVDGNMATVDIVTYDDGFPWTEMADGAGNSLALCSVTADNTMASNWLPESNDANLAINGTSVFASPGMANAATCPANPYRDIAILNTEDAVTGIADSIGYMAQIQGFVYGVNLRAAGLDFTVIDGFGNGISVFSFAPVSAYVVTEGDYVVINGTVGQFNGLIQFSPASIALVSGGHQLRNPSIVTALGEDTESELVTIENVNLVNPAQWSNSGSGFNVDITNGTDTFLMRIDNDVDLYALAVPTGTFNVTGIGRQFDNSNPHTDGYQLFPRYVADISPYNPTVVVPSYPAYSIGTVTTVNVDGVADSLGTQCEITGIVYGVDMQGSASISFTIIDATGGIGLFNSTDLGYTVLEGDEVTIQGTVGQFNGLTQIAPVSITLNSSGNALATAPVVTALDETTESELVTITNLTLVDPASWDATGASFNADFTDGTNTYAIRIDSDVNIAGTTPFVLATAVVKITGIGGQFDNSSPYTSGYQLFPRYSTDIEVITSTTNKLKESVKFYPNPVNSIFVIETTEMIETVRITNTLGQVVKTLNNVNGTTTVNVATLPQGMYFVTFMSENNSYTQQMVKQ
jgi:plastocyanin/DNA/RNA endonuclease YhcR with UshA esterase domain